MIDNITQLIYKYITLDYATYMIMLSYDFLQKTYTPISIGFFAFYTAILAFLYPQIIRTKTFLKQHSSEYLLNKFKEEKVVEYFLPITNASLLFSLFLIVFRCPFLLFVLSLVISLELLFLYYPSLRIMERYTFEKEKVYEEEFKKLYSDDFKMLKQINDENKELQDEQFTKDIKQPSLRRYYLLLSNCRADICNNLDDCDTNLKLIDLIIENWHKWIEFARRNHLSAIYCPEYNCEKRISIFLISGPLRSLFRIIISDNKTNLLFLFDYIISKLNFFKEDDTFEIDDKKYKIFGPHYFFNEKNNLIFHFINYDNSTNYYIELVLEELPKLCKEFFKAEEDYFDSSKYCFDFLKQIALRIIKKRQENVEIINKFFDALEKSKEREFLEKQTIVNYHIVLQILSYYITRNNYKFFSDIAKKSTVLFAQSNSMETIVKLFFVFVIQQYVFNGEFINGDYCYECEKHFIIFWLLCKNKFYNDHQKNIKNYNDKIIKYTKENYKNIRNAYCLISYTTDILDYLIEKFFSNSLLINGLFRDDDILQKQNDYKEYIKSVILTITDTINRERKKETKS